MSSRKAKLKRRGKKSRGDSQGPGVDPGTMRDNKCDRQAEGSVGVTLLAFVKTSGCTQMETTITLLVEQFLQSCVA